MSLSTTQYGYIIDPMVPFTDDKGKTIKNGFIRVFMAGTSTPVITYRNYDGATNQEKIELDNSGRVKHNVIGSKGSLYKVVVYNILHSQENPLLTVDKIAVLGASINATGATIVTGIDSVTVQEENFLKATVEGTGVELALDPTEVTSELSTIGAAETAAPDYVVPLLEKTGTEDSKKISLANLFKFALDWISRLATTITSFSSGDFIAVSNPTDGTRKMPKDTLLTLTSQNALAGNVALEFVPNVTNAVAGMPYVYGGNFVIAKEDYQGPWDSNKFEFGNVADFINALKTYILSEISPFVDAAKQKILFVEDGGCFYLIDNFGDVCLKIESDGTMFVPPIKGSGDTYNLIDKNNNVALKVNAAGELAANFDLQSVQNALKKLGKSVVGFGSDYSFAPPKYVFGIESSTLRGREYFTSIYPEGIVDIDDKPFLIDGCRKRMFQRGKSANDSVISTPVYEEFFRCKIGSPGYMEKVFGLKYIRANRLNAQNKKIFYLPIGDSLTGGGSADFPDGSTYGRYPNGVMQFAAMDNVDVGSIGVKTIGCFSRETITINYDGNEIECKSYSEGRGGWTTWDFANLPFHNNMVNASSADHLSKEALYYALGLATKTPFDSPTPSQAFTAYVDSDDTNALIISTPFGRYKYDCTESLWNALKLRSDFTGTGDYNAVTSDPIIEAYLDGKANDPVNPFYSLTTARAYAGSHVWTYECALSFTDYLSRYRTCDDDGVKLELGDGTGTKITAGNIDLIQVMTPTHITVCLGTNDNGVNHTLQAESALRLVNHIKTLMPTCHVGYFLPRATGVYSPELWTDRGVLNHKPGTTGLIGTRNLDTNKIIMDAIGDLPTSYGLSYIPVYFTGSPVSTSGTDRLAVDLDNDKELIVAGVDDIHPSAYWNRSAAYQVLAWIYWTLR